MRGRIKTAKGFGALALCSLLFMAIAAAAQAAPGYRSAGSFGDEVGTGHHSGKIAVEDATGNVIEAVQDNSRVRVFSADGTLLTELGPESEVFYPYGVAVDQSNGDLYIGDEVTGILRFVKQGGSPLKYTRDPTWGGLEAGSEPGQVGNFGVPLAVDPQTGDLLVDDRANRRVSRYTSAGIFVEDFDGSDTAEGAFKNPLDLAVAPDGDIYVIDLDGFVDPNEISGTPRIERFDAEGNSLGRIGAGIVEKGVSLAYDPVRGVLAVASQFGYVDRRPLLQVFQGNMLTDEVTFPSDSGKTATGLAVDGSSGRLYAATGIASSGELANVRVFDPVTVATLTIAPVDQITATTARLSGTVDPVGLPTEYHFEYSRDGGATWKSTATASAGEGNGPVPVEAAVTGLSANSEYVVRLAAENPQAPTTSGRVSFRTPTSAPGAVTGETTEVRATSAVLTGTVNPYGFQATYYFEYGPTAAYGSRAPASSDGPAGRGFDPRSVEEEVTELQPGTTYHYRLVAQSSLGPAFGADRTFTTAANGAAAGRVFELVSDAAGDESGTEVDHYWAHALPGGDGISFLTKTAFPGSASNSAPLFPRYYAARGTGSWSVLGLDPPVAQTAATTIFYYDALAVSEDGTEAVVASPKALAPGTVDGDSYLYLQDLATGAYTPIAHSEGSEFWSRVRTDNSSHSVTIIGGTLDFSRVYFQSEGTSFIEGAASFSVYEWSRGGGLRLVAENAGNAAGSHTREADPVSRDGSQVVYSKEATGEVWVSRNGENFLASTPNASTLAEELVGASPDGRYVVTTANDGISGSSSLYRFDTQTRELTTLSEDAAIQRGGLTMGRDAAYVYSIDGEQPPAVQVTHDGQTTRIAPLERSLLTNYRASPSGRYFVFGSRVNTTGFDSGGHEEIYRYDAVADDLVCASCRKDGGAAAGDAGLNEDLEAEFEGWFPRAVLDNGEVFFDTPDPLLPADVNSSRDVYSFDGSKLALISTGTGRGDSYFVDTGESGRDVFFTTQDRLVGKDTDSATDLYDARIGGGLPGQNEVASGASCEGEGCRGESPPAPPPPALGSETNRASGKSHRRPKKVCRKVKGKHGTKSRCGKKRHRAGKHGKGRKSKGKRQNGRAGR